MNERWSQPSSVQNTEVVMPGSLVLPAAVICFASSFLVDHPGCQATVSWKHQMMSTRSGNIVNHHFAAVYDDSSSTGFPFPGRASSPGAAAGLLSTRRGWPSTTS
jgi:hypothetical protein